MKKTNSQPFLFRDTAGTYIYMYMYSYAWELLDLTNLNISFSMENEKSCSGEIRTHDIYTAYEADALPTEAAQLAGPNQGNTRQRQPV